MITFDNLKKWFLDDFTNISWDEIIKPTKTVRKTPTHSLADKRLKKLADHLMSGRRGHMFFSIDHYNKAGYRGMETVKYHGKTIHHCGTTGCAVGELPFLFYPYFYFNKTFGVRTKDCNHTFTCVSEFFDLTKEEYEHLFLKGRQKTNIYGGLEYHEFTRPEEVAQNIQDFLEYRA